MNRMQRIAERLMSDARHRRVRHRVAGGVFALGFFIALVGSALSGSAMWMLALPLGAIAAWRLAAGGRND